MAGMDSTSTITPEGRSVSAQDRQDVRCVDGPKWTGLRFILRGGLALTLAACTIVVRKGGQLALAVIPSRPVPARTEATPKAGGVSPAPAGGGWSES